MKIMQCFLAVLLMSVGLTALAGPAYADHQVCSVDPQTHQVFCHVVHDPPPGHGAGEGGGGRNGCIENGMTIPCTGPQGSVWNAAHYCYSLPMNPPPPLGDPLWEGHTTGTVYRCLGGQGAGFFWSAQASPGPPPALQLAQIAATNLKPPTLDVASNTGTGAAATAYVGIPTWLWLQGRWAAVTSPPAAVAGESVTATATPTSVSWSMGDGHSTVCNGPGAPYSSSDPSDPPCGYTYRVDSSGQPQDGPAANDRYFAVRATVTWAVTWTCTGAACDQDGGSLPALPIASPATQWRVFQIETVVTGGH